MEKDGPRKGSLLPINKWGRAMTCESKNDIDDWSKARRYVAKVLCLEGIVTVIPISSIKGLFFVHFVFSG